MIRIFKGFIRRTEQSLTECMAQIGALGATSKICQSFVKCFVWIRLFADTIHRRAELCFYIHEADFRSEYVKQSGNDTKH